MRLGRKRCTKCRAWKSRRSFHAFNNGNGRYLRGDCKVCYNATIRAFRKQHPETCRTWDLRAAYGITVQDFKKLAVRQGNACAICRRTRKLAVDHDHATGAVRGLLCGECNMGLGRFNDSPELLRAAIEYLRAASSIRRAPALQAGGTRSEAGAVHHSGAVVQR